MSSTFDNAMDQLIDLLTYPVRILLGLLWRIFTWPIRILKLVTWDLLLCVFLYEVLIEYFIIQTIYRRLLVHGLGPLFAMRTTLYHKWQEYQEGSFYLQKKDRQLPIALQNVDYGGHPLEILELNDLKIEYATKGDPSLPLMICLHGLPGFWYSWRHQLKEFSSDYWVVAPNLKSFYRPPTPSGPKLARDTSYVLFDNLATDVVEFVKKLGRKDCTILAEGLTGGFVTWIIAEKYSEIICKCVVINFAHPGNIIEKLKKSVVQVANIWNSLHFLTPDVPLWALEAGDHVVLEELFNEKQEKKFKIARQDLEAFKYYYGQPGSWAHDGIYGHNFFKSLTHSLYNTNYKKMRFWELVKVPSLLIRGEHFRGCNLNISYSCANTFVFKIAVKEIPKANYCPQQQHPETVNKIIRDWINSVNT